MLNIVVKKLKASHLVKELTVESKEKFSNLICPTCGYPEAFMYKNNPFYIYCNRQNKCGAKISTYEFFGIHKSIEDNFPPNSSEPNRPATKYLELRGLSEVIPGLKYKYMKNVRGLGCGAVMFPVGHDDSGKEVKNGRIFNPPAGEGKTHNTGSVKGNYFSHPGRSYNDKTPLYITEGIINALSLICMGFSAIAVLSSNAKPADIELPSHKELILAFDNDLAGIKAMKKWERYKEDVKAILPPKGKDWNDYLVSAGNGKKARKRFDKKYSRWKFNAELALAATPKKYAEIFNNFNGYPPDLFAHKGCYYSGRLKQKNLSVIKVSNFTVEVHHFEEKDDKKSSGYVYHYFLKIIPQQGVARKIIMEGSELSTAGLMRTAFLSRGKVLWEGDKQATLALSNLIVNTKSAPVVRQIDAVGYDEISDGYYFRDFAIDSNGKKISIDSNGFFKFSAHEAVMPFSSATVKPSKNIVDLQNIYELIYDSWEDRGVISIAFVVASWFVNKIKPITGFFPFLSLYGDTQTGKSMLTRVLNYFQAIDEEGLPMMNTNTNKGGLRKIAQVSGLFKALIEGNSRENSSFDFSSLLPLYNKGNNLQTTAIKSMDTQTNEIPFLGTLMFVQNREPFKTKAEKERVISIKFDSRDITEETKESFDELMKISPQDLATFIVKILEHRQYFEDNWQSLFENNKNELRDIGDFRIIENHALILTFHQLLCNILEIDYDLKPYIIKIANLKRESCQYDDNPVFDLFFEQINSLSDEERKAFYEFNKEKELVYIHLPEALRSIKDLGYQLPAQHVLFKELKESSAFCKSSFKYRFSFEKEKGIDGRPKQKSVWVFDTFKM